MLRKKKQQNKKKKITSLLSKVKRVIKFCFYITVMKLFAVINSLLKRFKRIRRK